jgi:hypothetical protein
MPDLITLQFFLDHEESRVIQGVSTDSGGFDGQAAGVDRGD